MTAPAVITLTLSEREVGLVSVALDSAVRACSGGDTDELAKEIRDHADVLSGQ